MKGKALQVVITLSFFLFLTFSIQAAEPLSVVINEIAWMGTKANSADEWIELYNNTDQDINLEDWRLYEAGGETLIDPLNGIIKAKSYYLIERTDDTTISNIPASQTPNGWGGHGLKNSGEHLQLLDQNSTIIDEVNCQDAWFAGEGSPDYKTMERKNPQDSGSNPDNWVTNNREILNGQDAKGNPINGTPKAENSVGATIEEFFPKTVEESPAQTEPQPEPETQLGEAQQQTEEQSEPEPELAPKEQSQPEPKTQSEEEPQPITYPSGVLINEVLPSPQGQDELEEWFELFNGNEFEVNLAGWQIRDGVGVIKTYTFPEGTKINAGAFLICPRIETKITLQNQGDTLELLNPNGEIVHKISYQKAPRGQSFNRVSLEKEFLAPLEKDSLMGQTEQAETNWDWSASLTPGEINIITKPEIPKTEFPETSEANEEKTNPPQVSDVEKNKKALAKIGAELPKSSSSLFIFLIAVAIAISSAIIVLILKKRIKSENIASSIQDNTFKYK